MLIRAAKFLFDLRLFSRKASSSSDLSVPFHKVPLNVLDKKWKRRWNETFPNGSIHSSIGNDNLKSKDKPFYCLTMFPYPSGNLHLGHQRVYTISDVIARYKKLKGHQVIHPMGWDAFGLPAENAAFERGEDPAKWTEQNVEHMRKQFDLMLVDFNWDIEINTSSPDYYRWTQKLFTLLFKNGLAYRAGAVINWDPVDQTVLANEQVDSEGRSWRSGAVVEKRELKQWFIGITKYAESLLEDLKLLTGWPEKVKSMQRNWIGLSKGAVIQFPTSSKEFPSLQIFTTRPDTLFCVQFLALSLEHPLVQSLAKTDEGLANFILKYTGAEQKNTMKNGYELKNLYASIPITVDGLLNETYNVPIFVAPYVVAEYGYGAVMGCPSHDTRDQAFWSLHRPESLVFQAAGPLQTLETGQDLLVEKGVLVNLRKLPHLFSSLGILDGMTSVEAGDKICSVLSGLKKGQKTTKLRIRDWLISRQRYWGAPIPIIHCDSCGPVPVPDKDLPVLLPKVSTKNFGKGNPLGSIDSFVSTTCPSCGSAAKRETDTMDTFLDSSWYFFRFCDSRNTREIFSREKVTKSMPVDIYSGGVEHAILHLLYLRFISKFLGDFNIWDGLALNNEPIKRLVTQGMVHGKTYKDPETGRFLKPNDVVIKNANTAIIKNTGKAASCSYEKMSKSKFNGVDPTTCIEKYGADAVRAYTLFSAPISDVLLWNEDQILGTERWLKKVLKMGLDIVAAVNERKGNLRISSKDCIVLNGTCYDKSLFYGNEINVYNATEELVHKVSTSIDVDLSLNTVISDYMKLTNLLQSALKEKILPEILLDSYKKLLICIAPVTPSVAEECWEFLALKLNQRWSSIFKQRYPEYRPALLSLVNYTVILNGKRVYAFETETCLANLPDADIISLLAAKLPEKHQIDPSVVSKIVVKKGIISVVCK